MSQGSGAIGRLLARHAQLESRYGDGDGGRFLSGWQCLNPWRNQFDREIEAFRSSLDPSVYYQLDEDRDLENRLVEFHATVDRVRPPTIFCGEGSTPLLFAFCVWLRSRGVTEISYIPPLYFTLQAALKTFGIRCRAVSGLHPYEPGFRMNLPCEKTVLVLCDPTWYVGLRLANDVIETIRKWQSETKSTIFVDGSFQYMRWDGRLAEASASFSPSRTIRLICPTKSMALHGYRFAYVIMGRKMRRAFGLAYSALHGSNSVGNVAFAKYIASDVFDRSLTASLARLASETHARLRVEGRIWAQWFPDCGYFVFERPPAALLRGGHLMDGAYFDQPRYSDYRRINLLSPSIGVLDERTNLNRLV